jgi:transposase
MINQNTVNEDNQELLVRGNIPKKLKIALIKMVDCHGFSIINASNILNINYSSAKNIVWGYRKTGKITNSSKEASLNARSRNRPSLLGPQTNEIINTIVKELPGITIKQIHEILVLENNITCSISTVKRMVKQLRFSFKKATKVLEKVNIEEMI